MSEEMDALAAGFLFAYPLPPEYRYKSVEVAANDTATLWSLDMQQDLKIYPNYSLLITEFACGLHDNSTLKWTIDTTGQIEPMRSMEWNVTVSFGSREHPLNLSPGLLILNNSEMVIENADSSKHTYWTFVWGGFIQKRIFKKASKLLLEDI